jgi:hypothetical protein
VFAFPEPDQPWSGPVVLGREDGDGPETAEQVLRAIRLKS